MFYVYCGYLISLVFVLATLSLHTGFGKCLNVSNSLKTYSNILLQRIVESVNVIIATYGDDEGPMGIIQVDPTRGTVGFGSGLHAWGFTLKNFGEMYADKFKIEVPKMMKKMWGDNFFSASEKKWKNQFAEGYVRGFNQFVLDPIYKVFDSIMGFKKDASTALIKKLGVTLKAEENDLEGKALLKVFYYYLSLE